ncbi:hypothetical protein [Streptomyces sp. NPDC059874]|uniref:hypothetical protein n=1 Tax=Streptomyces sp. NPDC059874 TaxID=3346983 RepID=UPI0036671E2A
MSEGGEGYSPRPEESKQGEQPPVRLPLESVRSKGVEENLIPYVTAHFAHRDYWAEDGTPQERAAKEAAAGFPTSPEGEVYDELMGTAFAEVSQATRGPDGAAYAAAFADLDAARAAFLLLSLSRSRFTARELYSNLGDVRIVPAEVELTPRQAKLVELLAKRATLPYDASQTSVADHHLDYAVSRVHRSNEK